MNTERILKILQSPHVSEKSTRIAGEGNQYVFKVIKDATKSEVKSAVEEVFGVKVRSVNIMNVKGKTRSFKMRAGKRADWKKAYVRLNDGEVIEFAEASAN